MKKIFVAGGAGYIGSHTVVELIEAGYDPIVADNFCNSSKTAIKRIEKITGRAVKYYDVDICNRNAVSAIFDFEKPEAVMMFAGYKAVGESVEKPLMYYYNNLTSLMELLYVMRDHDCRNIIFSSSATVYGDPDEIPVTEECPKGEITNPYGQTKSMIEQILTDVCKADSEFSATLLRYFNPIGAHASGLIGEDPNGIPNNLVPYISQVAVGRRKELHIFGNDYDTPDGTGIRDYIHVCDLAYGHVCALKDMTKGPGLRIYNLGTGTGYSVLDVLKAYENACGHEIPYVIDKRRPGDIARCFCDPKKAYKEMGWKAERSLLDMCKDAWNWQSRNPDGYKGVTD